MNGLKELKDALEAHARKDEKFQQNTQNFEGEMAAFQAETEGSLGSIHAKLDNVPSKEEMASIVEDVFTKLLLSKGKTAFTVVVGLGILVTSLIAIFGGFKTFLGWIGFSLIPRP